MRGYSGGALDTRRQRLVVWGGGHADYPGNEVYAIELSPVQRATRLTDPSPYGLGTQEALSDGRPASRHTYAGLVYLPEEDALWAHGGSLWREGWGSNGTWMFRFGDGRWERRADYPDPGYGGKTLATIAAYDPVTKLIIVKGRGHLSTYDPATDRWVRRGPGEGTDSERTGVIDPSGRRMYVIGWTRGRNEAGRIRVIDLQRWSETVVVTSGAVEIASRVAPGADLDPVTGEMVAWAGGRDVFRLDLAGLVWRKVTVAEGPAPGPAPWEGTYGRFRWVPSLGRFVAVSSIDENAFLYGPGPCGK